MPCVNYKTHGIELVSVGVVDGMVTCIVNVFLKGKSSAIPVVNLLFRGEIVLGSQSGSSSAATVPQ